MTHAGPAVGTVHVNGVRLGYREVGDPDGTPVVLLHGSGSSAPTWDRLAEALAGAGYRAIALDLRGHASSERTPGYALTSLRDDVLGLLEALDLHDVVLIGHSVGGYAALAVALHSADRVARLVLEDVAAPPRAAEPATPAALLRLLGTGAGILVRRRDYELRALASLVRQLARPDPAWWDRLGEVGRPVLVFSGGPASCIPPRRLAELAAALPDARLVTIPVGHRVHSLAPGPFATETLAFLTAARTGAGLAS